MPLKFLPGIADYDGQAGGEEHEDEEELLGWPAILIRKDGAGPNAGVKTKVTPERERGWNQEGEATDPGTSYLYGQPRYTVQPRGEPD